MSNQTHQILEPEKAQLHVALICPEIPQNTGNIARLCRATGAKLVLVRPLGFRLTDSGLQRAGMDYWKELNPLILDDTEDFLEWLEDKTAYFLTAHGNKNYAQVSYKSGDVLVFGSESSGLTEDVQAEADKRETKVTLPMIKDARCINVSSSVSATVYEALRQIYNWTNA